MAKRFHKSAFTLERALFAERRCPSGTWRLLAFSVGRRVRRVLVRPKTGWLLFLFLVGVAPWASAQTSATKAPTVETILARMAEARARNDTRLRPYTVTRDYELFGKEAHKAKSQVTADVTFVPPSSKEYVVQRADGTGLGERVVRRMLKSEADIARHYLSTDFSTANYGFRFVREEEVSGLRCYVLELIPRRSDKNLLRGSIWVDANTYLVRRTEGEPSRSPSWWVKDVRVTLFYGEVSGMWLQTGLQATARVRILGPHRVVARDVKYAIGGFVAVASSDRNQSVTPPLGASALLAWTGPLVIDLLASTTSAVPRPGKSRSETSNVVLGSSRTQTSRADHSAHE